MLLIGRTLQEIMTARDTLTFLWGLVKSEKVNPTTSETVGISGVTDKYRGNDTVTLRRKTGSYNSTMSGGLLSTQNFSVQFDEVNWPTFVNGPSYVAGENSISFPLTGANIKQGSYQGYHILGNVVRKELLWWIENIRLPNGRKIQKQEPQVTIQKDMLSKIDGEHIAMEYQQAGNG